MLPRPLVGHKLRTQYSRSDLIDFHFVAETILTSYFVHTSMAAAKVLSSSLPAAPLAASLVTQHLYYDDTELFSCTGRVIAQYAAAQEGRDVIILDRTVLHPQGGETIEVITHCISHFLC